MTSGLRRIAVFGLLFVPSFVVFLAVYLAIFPVYDQVVVASANFVTKQFAHPTHLVVLERGGWQAFVFIPERGQQPMRDWFAGTAHLIYLSLVTLPALLLATPVPWRKRLGWLALGLPLAFISHVLSAILLTRGTHCLQQAPGTFSCLWALRVAYTSGQLFAAAFWIPLTWRHWFPPERG